MRILLVLAAMLLMTACSNQHVVKYMTVCMAEKPAIVTDCEQYAKERAAEDKGS